MIKPAKPSLGADAIGNIGCGSFLILIFLGVFFTGFLTETHSSQPKLNESIGSLIMLAAISLVPGTLLVYAGWRSRPWDCPEAKHLRSQYLPKIGWGSFFILIFLGVFFTGFLTQIHSSQLELNDAIGVLIILAAILLVPGTLLVYAGWRSRRDCREAEHLRNKSLVKIGFGCSLILFFLSMFFCVFLPRIHRIDGGDIFVLIFFAVIFLLPGALLVYFGWRSRRGHSAPSHFLIIKAPPFPASYNKDLYIRRTIETLAPEWVHASIPCTLRIERPPNDLLSAVATLMMEYGRDVDVARTKVNPFTDTDGGHGLFFKIYVRR